MLVSESGTAVPLLTGAASAYAASAPPPPSLSAFSGLEGTGATKGPGVPDQLLLPISGAQHPPKPQNALKMGCFATKKRVKNGSMMCFSQNDPRPIGGAETSEMSHF